MIDSLPLANSSLHIGGFQWTGDFTTVDLIAASTNSLNGALLARRPDHYKNWTVVGILLMALLMGLGGGITRDVLVGQVPSALTNPAYIVLALTFGTAGYLMAYKGGQLFREGLFQFMTSFSLPWYAIAGAQKGVEVGLPIAGVLALAVVGPTAGRWYVDVSTNVPPKQFVQGEWFVATAALTGFVWLVALSAGRLDCRVCRNRVHGRLRVPRDRAVPDLGGAAPEGANRRLHPRRRASDAGTEAQGQVEART